MTTTEMIRAPLCMSCGKALGYVAKGTGRMKIPVRSRLIAVRLCDGVAEMNCPQCGAVAEIGLTVQETRVPARVS